eukprot:2899829-Amphidinium_carterae.1
MKPPNVLEALKIVPAGELWVPIGACYGFRSAPKRWEKTRDQELEGIKTKDWHLIQSKTHSGIWYIVGGAYQPQPPHLQWMPEDSC